MREIVSTVILLGVVQGAVLAVILWRREGNRLASRLLGALVALVALMLAAGEVERRWGYPGHPHLLGLSAPLPFLFAPLLYLYVVALTRPVTRPDPRWLVHAMPFLGDALYLAQVFYFEPPPVKLALARAAAVGDAPTSFHVVSALGVAQALAYLGLAWVALARYDRKVHGYFSDLVRIDLRWLRTLVASHAAVWTVVLATTVARWMGTDPEALAPAVQVASAIATFITGYVSLWQPDLAAKATAAQVADPASIADPVAPVEVAEAGGAAPASAPERRPPPRYERNRLDDDEARELLAKLDACMDGARMYRDPGLTLSTLADALGIPPHTLSQLLNVRLGKNFFEYVNGRRAEALMAALADGRNAQRGILELGFEAGFSSKSTLNGFFRKHTGATPTAFRARAAAEDSAAKTAG